MVGVDQEGEVGETMGSVVRRVFTGLRRRSKSDGEKLGWLTGREEESIGEERNSSIRSVSGTGSMAGGRRHERARRGGGVDGGD
jgi:hypothetical protein